MPDNYAGPQVFIDIFPHEGGLYAITGGQVLRCVTEKNLDNPAGNFTISLAPGGPNGPNIGPSWLDIITPMSFVVIAMARGQYRQVVMLGVVTNTTEDWSYLSGRGEMLDRVERSVTIVGQDFGYFFSHFGWYALTFISGPAGALGLALNNQNAGTLAQLGGNLTQGTPDEIGAAWYNQVMDGGNGILSKTFVEYGKDNGQGGKEVLFQDAATVQFEKYVDDIKIPFTFSFVSTEETFDQKFRKIFPFPWYEFFVITAPVGFYGNALTTSWNSVNAGGQAFSSTGLGSSIASQVYVIARVNPLPGLKADGSGGTLTFGDMDLTAWNAMPKFRDSLGFLTTTEGFTEAEVRNFYVINPTFMKSLLGQANDAVIPPVLNVSAAVDPASIHRYGFRPLYMETEWFADIEGQAAQQQKVDFANIFAHLTARLASQFEPVPLMMRAQRSGVLRPDFMPGCKFEYQPLKDKIASPWTFYIEGVTHEYNFGGLCRTMLLLSRGLPTSVYNNFGLLKDIHMGNAQRLNGEYQTGLPTSSFDTEQGLEPISLLSEQVQKVLADIAPIYSTAQRR